MGKKQAGENGKKVAGNAKKAEAAAQKAAQEDTKASAAESQEWSKGSKSTAKKDEAEAKKLEAARKKAEKDALLAAEEASLPSKPATKTAKKPQTPSRGLDLAQLDDNDPSSSSAAATALNATGIDNALDALALTAPSDTKVDRHPERRFKAAFAAFEARRLPEVEAENPGLRRQQRNDLLRKEFERSPDNPFNQVSAQYDATKEDVKALKKEERAAVEKRLGGS